MRCIVNKYAKSCANCTLKVAVAEGFAVCSDETCGRLTALLAAQLRSKK